MLWKTGAVYPTIICQQKRLPQSQDIFLFIFQMRVRKINPSSIYCVKTEVERCWLEKQLPSNPLVAILEIVNFMKKIIQIAILLLFFDSQIEAQNLIMNGDFEDCLICPDFEGQLELCPNWFIPNNSTPDLFKKCNFKSYVNIPMNAVGYQDAFSGEAYAGLALIYNENRNYSEYIGANFTHELEENVSYLVSFYLSWADYSNYFCDRIGYLFTTNKTEHKKKRKNKGRFGKAKADNILLKSNGYVFLNYDSIKDRQSWHKVEFTYHANGGERYLVLGLFADNITDDDYRKYMSKSFGKPSNFGSVSYYYIDNISVEPLKKIEYSHEHPE
jgi:OmpA-OmpF porin, OOP family